MRRLIVIGAAGMGREVAWMATRPALDVEPMTVVGFVVTRPDELTQRDSRVLGGYDWLEAHASEWDCLALGIGEPLARARVAREVCERFPSASWPTIAHPSAVIDPRVCELARGVIVLPGVVGTVGIHVGEFALLSYSATIGHECTIGRAAVVYPGANIGGGVTIGETAMIGAGAQVLQYRKIGAGARVGAGAVVTRDVPPGVTVTGIPARPVR